MNYLIKFLFMRIHTGPSDHSFLGASLGAASVIYHMRECQRSSG